MNADVSGIMVLGMGNILKGDDGAGIAALERLREDPRTPPGLDFVDGGTLGLELLQYAFTCTHLLVFDAVDFDSVPGAVVALNGENLGWLKGGATAHDLGFADLLAAMKLLGREPATVKLIGVQPENLELGTTLSPSVKNALPHMTTLALAQIEEWIAEAGSQVEQVVNEACSG